jgi:hypothetical protein
MTKPAAALPSVTPKRAGHQLPVLAPGTAPPRSARRARTHRSEAAPQVPRPARSSRTPSTGPGPVRPPGSGVRTVCAERLRSLRGQRRAARRHPLGRVRRRPGRSVQWPRRSGWRPRDRGLGRSISISATMAAGRGDRTMTRSDSSTASLTEWVTRIVVVPRASQMRGRSCASCRRVSSSTAPNGSSSSRSPGRVAARAQWPRAGASRPKAPPGASRRSRRARPA